jgi:hypothetical protein
VEIQGSCFSWRLELFLQLSVPEPAFDGCERLVVVVAQGSGRKRRIEVEHVLQPECERRVIQPSAPATRIVLSRRDWHYVFHLAILHLGIPTPVIGKAGHLSPRRRWQVKRVRRKQVECNPLTHFPRPPRQRPTSRHLWFRRLGQSLIDVLILAGVMHGCTRIEPSEPRVCRAIVERAKVLTKTETFSAHFLKPRTLFVVDFRQRISVIVSE